MTTRRQLVRGLLLAPLAGLAPGPVAATDYASAAEALTAVDRMEAEVDARWAALAQAVPAARKLKDAFRADHQVHRAARAQVRKRLGLPTGPAPSALTPSVPSLAALRKAQEALVYAHAEGLPALGDANAVATLARHLVVESRQLAVIGLWMDAEATRG